MNVLINSESILHLADNISCARRTVLKTQPAFLSAGEYPACSGIRTSFHFQLSLNLFLFFADRSASLSMSSGELHFCQRRGKITGREPEYFLAQMYISNLIFRKNAN